LITVIQNSSKQLNTTSDHSSTGITIDVRVIGCQPILKF